MIDIILLPLMPLFIQINRFMWQMILAFRGFTKNLGANGLISVLFGLTPQNPATKPTMDFLQWLFMTMGGIAEGLMNVAGYGILDLALKWLYDLWWMGGQLYYNTNWAGLFDKLLDWLYQMWLGLSNFVDIHISAVLQGIANDIYNWWKNGLDIIAHITGLDKGPAAAIISPQSAWVQAAGNPLSLDSGGLISKTGAAIVHKGETITPAGKGGGITVNITGQFKSDEEMYQKFVTRLRQQGMTSIL